MHGALSGKGTNKDKEFFIIFSYIEFRVSYIHLKMLPLYKTDLLLSVDRDKAIESMY